MDSLESAVKGLEKCFDMMKCSICLNLITQPTAAIPCGHLFCFTCLKRALNYTKLCPLCKQPINKRRGLRQENDLTDLLSGLIRIKRSKTYKKALAITETESTNLSQEIDKLNDLDKNLPKTINLNYGLAQKITSKASKPQNITPIHKILRIHTTFFNTPINPNTCVVCFGSLQNQKSKVVACTSSGCKTLVHVECYGSNQVNEPWTCSFCQIKSSLPDFGVSNFSCFLCGSNDSIALKFTIDYHLVHLFCATWIPEIKIENNLNELFISGIESIPKERFQLSCSVCKTKKIGCCIQCSYKRCSRAVHPLCALKAGLELQVLEPNENSGPQYLYYCDKHSKSQQHQIHDSLSFL